MKNKLLIFIILLITLPANLYVIYDFYKNNSDFIKTKTEEDNKKMEEERAITELEAFNNAQWDQYSSEWEKTKVIIGPLLACEKSLDQFSQDNNLYDYYRKNELDQIDSNDRKYVTTYEAILEIKSNLGVDMFKADEAPFNGGIFVYGNKDQTDAKHSLDHFLKRFEDTKKRSQTFKCNTNTLKQYSISACKAIIEMSNELKVPNIENYRESDDPSLEYEKDLARYKKRSISDLELCTR